MGDYVTKNDLLTHPVTVVIASALVMVGVYKIGTLTFGRKRPNNEVDDDL